ncbi:MULTISPECIES: substrate-binding periplasmic protein [Bradyrhizobium]|uniref:substrate-binding periplasmic protein n=1 Tax=Bradyrhizobium TaxID=374 RepID=UPI00155ED679|nr:MULTISPECIES: ABC transporter substrate-binding protein [Bradyrhizobium]MDD1523637.1 amino acid ABC transporter substrate-binding protein [Bradyrhizobium sp. WBAH30]MDD1547723.1 amino acid ABC transporter substrate-binding protein [Bradyrhizobium sp. WBAH41]MDD1561364.1 amino acid ABC transporter substrate-binding protein [Bradyrhizobium sp. WBAH23]MDD1568804.1 amino acid ABC transporter substrate-binding protein [Bradyrhizobium sp. WBAH33]MDD1594778.1 amino acid ABC transporter substrate-b
MPKIAAILWLGASLVLNGTAWAAEKIKVGVTTTGIPFTFVDPENHEIKGAMVDLAKAIAADNGWEVSFEIVAFSALIPSLNTGKIDLISAGMLVTDQRKEAVSFADPVFAYGEAMFVAADDRKNYTLEALKAQPVGAQIGSAFVEPLKGLGLFSDVKLYDGIADIMREVKLGRVKAGFGDQPIVAYQIVHNPALGVRLVEGYKPLKSSDVAPAVAKQNVDLLRRVNASIGKLKASGELARIFAKYNL